jgi:hypothetical protein
MPMYMDIHENPRSYRGRHCEGAQRRCRNAAEVWRRVSQILVQRELRQDFLPL